ncbi:uncharacterized protein LOC135399791 isoform X2 [Ornithodoros turicata]
MRFTVTFRTTLSKRGIRKKESRKNMSSGTVPPKSMLPLTSSVAARRSSGDPRSTNHVGKFTRSHNVARLTRAKLYTRRNPALRSTAEFPKTRKSLARTTRATISVDMRPKRSSSVTGRITDKQPKTTPRHMQTKGRGRNTKAMMSTSTKSSRRATTSRTKKAANVTISIATKTSLLTTDHRVTPGARDVPKRRPKPRVTTQKLRTQDTGTRRTGVGPHKRTPQNTRRPTKRYAANRERSSMRSRITTTGQKYAHKIHDHSSSTHRTSTGRWFVRRDKKKEATTKILSSQTFYTGIRTPLKIAARHPQRVTTAKGLPTVPLTASGGSNIVKQTMRAQPSSYTEPFQTEDYRELYDLMDTGSYKTSAKTSPAQRKAIITAKATRKRRPKHKPATTRLQRRTTVLTTGVLPSIASLLSFVSSYSVSTNGHTRTLPPFVHSVVSKRESTRLPPLVSRQTRPTTVTANPAEDDLDLHTTKPIKVHRHSISNHESMTSARPIISGIRGSTFINLEDLIYIRDVDV